MWRNRNVWILLTGELIAGLGLWFGMIGNLEFLQHNVPSDFMKAVLLMAGTIVGVLIAPYAGSVVDRTEKKRVLQLAGVLRIVAVLFMFAALELNSVWWMVGFAVLTGVSASFYFPALQALVPLIVKDEDLLAANGALMNIGTMARVFGAAAAGALLVVISLKMLYVLSLVGYASLLVYTQFLRVEKDVKPERKSADETKATATTPSARKKEKSGFKDVFPIMKGNPMVMMTVLLAFVPYLFIGSFNLMVIDISERLDDSTIKGLLYTVEGLSLLVGAYLIKLLTKGRNIAWFVIFATLLVAVATLLLFFSDHRMVAILSFGLFGFAAGAFFPLSATLFQKQVPREFHGRFFSFKSMLDRTVMQVVMLMTGLLLDTVGFKWMIAIFSVFSFSMVAHYGIRQLTKPLAYVDAPNGSQEKLQD